MKCKNKARRSAEKPAKTIIKMCIYASIQIAQLGRRKPLERILDGLRFSPLDHQDQAQDSGTKEPHLGEEKIKIK